MASNEHLCLIKSHILRESDKLRLIKTMVEEKNSQTHIGPDLLMECAVSNGEVCIRT